MPGKGAKGALERGKRCAGRFLARAVVGFCGNEDIMSLPPAFWDPFLVWGALCFHDMLDARCLLPVLSPSLSSGDGTLIFPWCV